jgi:hypothetical protein
VTDRFHSARPGRRVRGLQGWLPLTLVCAVGCFDGLIEDPGYLEMPEPPGPGVAPNLPGGNPPNGATPVPSSTSAPIGTPAGPHPGGDSPIGLPDPGDETSDAGVVGNAGDAEAEETELGDAGTSAESSGMSLSADSGLSSKPGVSK